MSNSPHDLRELARAAREVPLNKGPRTAADMETLQAFTKASHPAVIEALVDRLEAVPECCGYPTCGCKDLSLRMTTPLLPNSPEAKA